MACPLIRKSELTFSWQVKGTFDGMASESTLRLSSAFQLEANLGKLSKYRFFNKRS